MNTLPSRISMLFAGDFAPCRRYGPIVLEKGSGIFGDALELIKRADISFVNLECPLTNSQANIIKDGPCLKADPESAAALRDFSVVGLANNHIMDYGPEGLKDTIAAVRQAGPAYVGAGRNIHEAREALNFRVKGLNIALIAFAEREFNQASDDMAGASPLDAVACARQIIAAKKASDVVIVTIHGGNEYFPFPRPKYREICRFFIELGASAVVCHHPHVPGAYEYHNGCPVFYSIGNVIFDSSTPKEGWWEGFFVKLELDVSDRKVVNVETIPYRQHPESGGLRLLGEVEASFFNEGVAELSRTLSDEAKWIDAWQAFVDSNSSSYLTKQYSPLLFRGIYKVSKLLKFNRLLLRRSDVAKKLNLIQCDAHKDLLEELLRDSMPPRPK